MLLDGIVGFFWSIVQSEGLETDKQEYDTIVKYQSNNERKDMTVQYYTH